jgi:hypothetical protein
MKNTMRVSFVAMLTSLLVACGGGGSGGCSAVLGILPGAGCSSTPNAVPVANAGVTQNVSVGSLVTLDGSGSRDANNQSLTYLWQLSSAPSGSLAALSSLTSAKPTFTADVAGTYTLSLVVNDGKANSTASTVSVFSSVNNSAPVASAGPNQSVTVGSVVTLDGTASTDANRDPLTFKWSLSNVPTGSTASLSSSIAPAPQFKADIAGTYTAILTVNDGKADSLSSAVVITASNTNLAPEANAGLAQSVKLNDLVTLDGTGSKDANNDFLTYKWVLITKPTGSNATLISDTSSKPTFRADAPGTFVASLIVNDGKLFSNAAATTVNVATANAEPIANAGVNQNATLDSWVMLDGTNSTDANRDPLTFRWALMSSPPGYLLEVDPLAPLNSPKPKFKTKLGGTYVFNLIVNDGRLDSTNIATATITASNLNRPPEAVVADKSVVLTTQLNPLLTTSATSVTLDGTASRDPDGDPLTYEWRMVSRPTASKASLTNAASSMPTFMAEEPGVYVFSLIVSDGKLFSAPKVVSVTATAQNIAPDARAGANQNVAIDPITKIALVTLDGSASSDANGDTLTYSWTLVSKPANSSAILSDADTAKPTFIADKVGPYVAALIVNDKKLDSKVSTTTVTAAIGNTKPNADAGPIQSVFIDKNKGPTIVTLDGSNSTDQVGDTLTYTWKLFSKPLGSSAQLDNVNSVKPKFAADMVGTYAASLVVCDQGNLCDEIKTTYAVAAAANVAPIANAGKYQNVVKGSTVTLDGSNSTDQNGDTLTYIWALVSQPVSLTSEVKLSLNDPIKPTFTATAAGTYVFSLKVSDGTLESPLQYVTITAGEANVEPDAKLAQSAITTSIGSKVVLDGSSSTDANGDTIIFRWTLISQPTNSVVALTGSGTYNPFFTPTHAGFYVVSLVASDGRLDSKPVVVVVTVTP